MTSLRRKAPQEGRDRGLGPPHKYPWSTSRLIGDNDGPYIDRPIFALPVPQTWEHDPALALARSATVADAVRDHEETMLPRWTERPSSWRVAPSDC
ncbi:hypothetical protein [Spongiactinospora gelatinilytica]|uniref:hypothetical protein n=1 Tax=Spongiactinospora gelatinilytica TaxID=2666298 RepID=UPI0018F46736|nr:hypothetical protein [Spongiactinospora gelatinilytica]